MSRNRYPAIPPPQMSLESLFSSVQAIKQVADLIVGRLDEEARALRVSDLTEAEFNINRLNNKRTAGSGEIQNLDAIWRRLHRLFEQERKFVRAEVERARTQAVSEFVTALAENGVTLTDVQNASADEILTAGVVALAATRISENSALAGEITRVSATAEGTAAVVTNTAIARAADDEAFATFLQTITAAGGDYKIIVQETEPAAPVGSEEIIWVDTANGNLLKTWDGMAWVAYGDNRYGLTLAAILNEQTARITEDSAIVTSVSTLSATVDDNTAAITAETIARVNADSAFASNLTQINAVFDNSAAYGFMEFTAYAGGTGVATEFAVRVKAQSGGGAAMADAGLYLQALSGGGAGTSRVVVETDQFLVRGPGASETAVFEVSGGVVKIDGDLIIDGTLHGDAIIANTIQGDRIEAGTLSSQALIVGGGNNLVPNGGFEEGEIGWNFPTGTTLGTSPSVAYSGNNYMLLDKSTLGGGNASSSSRSFPVVEGKSYFVTGWFKTVGAGASSEGTYFRVRWYEDDGVTFISNSGILTDQGVASAWTEYNAIVTAPANARWATVQLIQLGTSARDAIRVDNIHIVDSVGTVMIEDGAIVADKISANAITSAKIASNAITANKIAANVIDASHIVAESITAARVNKQSSYVMSTGTGYETVCTITLNVQAGRALLNAYVFMNGGIFDVTAKARLRYESGVIGSAVIMGSTEWFTILDVTDVTAGSRTFDLQIQRPSGATGMYTLDYVLLSVIAVYDQAA